MAIDGDHNRVIADILTEALERTGRTRRKLAQILSVSEQSVGGWVSGKRALPMKRAEELALLLEIEPEKRQRLIYHAAMVKADANVLKVVREASERPDAVRPEDFGVPDWHKRLVFTLDPDEAGAHLFERYVPIEGEYEPEFGIIASAEALDDERKAQYLVFGRVPTGSIAVSLSVETEGLPARTMVIFGPEGSIPGTGMGLFSIDGRPSDIIGRFSRTSAGVVIFRADGETELPRAVITAFRPFIALA